MISNNLESDFNKLINPDSSEFDIDFYTKTIDKFGSIENYKLSDEWKGISDIYIMIELIKQSN